MKISVFGTGYVGLVTGVCFAEMGNDVICADINEKKISDLQKGICPIYEAGLQELIIENSKQERLTFTQDLIKAIAESQILFVAVGTPPTADGNADLKYVFDVADTIAKNMNEYKA